MKINKFKEESFKTVKIALLLLIGIVFLGVIGYIFIERYTFIEAFFMTIITMSTVGFQEVHPLSDAGRIFTAFLIVVSFGIFAYAITTLTRYIVDGIFRHYFMDTKIKNRIQKLKNHAIVCGYGRNGRQSAEELIRYNVEVVLVDKDETIIDEIRSHTQLLYIQGDATNDEILENANIQNARALITALPNDADNLFVVLTARDHNPNLSIITRAADANSVKKLKSAGATNVIMPDSIGGQRMAKLVTQPDVIEFLDYIILPTPDEVYIEEISCKNLDTCLAEKSIGEWAIRQKTGANIIGLKTKNNEFIVNPTPDVKITSSDQIFVLGTKTQINNLNRILLGKEDPE